MKKILIIPHHPDNVGVKIRLAEIARYMAKDAQVYLVSWHAASGGYNIFNRLFACVKDILTLPKLSQNNRVIKVEFPILHQPVFIARIWNSIWLDHMIKKIKPQAVINGSYYLFAIKNKENFKYIVDLADLPPKEKKLLNWTIEQAVLADQVVTVSGSLAEYVAKEYKLNAKPIGNGFDLSAFEVIDPEKVKRLRQQYGLDNAFVIGYAGFIGEWIDIDLAVCAVKEFKKIKPNAIAVFVGESTDLNHLKNKYKNDPVIFTGKVSQDIETYIAMFDLGILPSKPSLFQDMAFHLKIIEYTAGEKPIVSTPLKEVLRLNFGNIIFAQLSVQDWVAALTKACTMSKQSIWRDLAKPYDWKMVVNDFLRLI